MPRIKGQRRKKKEGRAAIYALVSDQSQDAEGKIAIAEQRDLQGRVVVPQGPLREHVVEWPSRVGNRLDELPDEERREVLRLLLDEATIDGENIVRLTLGIPTKDLQSIGTPVSSCLTKQSNRHEC